MANNSSILVSTLRFFLSPMSILAWVAPNSDMFTLRDSTTDFKYLFPSVMVFSGIRKLNQNKLLNISMYHCILKQLFLEHSLRLIPVFGK